MKSKSAPAEGNVNLKRATSTNSLLGLWHMMAGFRLIYLAAALTLGLGAVSKTGSFLLLRYLVDNVLAQSTVTTTILIPIALGFVGLAIFEGIFTFLSGKYAAQTAEGLALRLRNFLFDHVQHLSFSYHDRNQTGELIQRSTSDVDAIRRFFLDQAIGLGRIVLLFVINWIAILFLNVQLGLISVVSVPVIIVLSVYFFRRISTTYEAFQESDGELSTILQENLTGVRVVKAFARQDYERQKFQRKNWERLVKGNRTIKMHSTFWPISEIICGFQMLTGYMLGVLLVLNGTMTLGTYLAYGGLLVWLIWPMRNLGRLIFQMSTGLVSFGRVMEIIREDREPLHDGSYAPSQPIQGEIVFEDVRFAYQADSPVLHGISFRVESGQKVALMGSTGSGKTTVINLLPRFYEYSGGRILLDGVELSEYSRDFLRRQIGVVEQQPFLFSRTIRENISYGVGRAVSQQEVEAAARAAAIHDVILSFPNGYDTLVGEKGVTLSGGQKQRVALARTLLKDPRILILDDATSSVDSETEADIHDALQSLIANRTTFIIAHRVQTVASADLILVFHKGQIVQRGRHDELATQAGIYRDIFDVQSRIESELEKEIARV
ncbi:MAG TPA: ABC transporter ATP-binding protein [Aggregatilineales bacterium]|nr:ABC transporter ATP-binding protein [Aggregatilineales bacterium]